MSWYTGTGQRPTDRVALPPSLEQRYAHPGGYRADPGLIDAVNVALQRLLELRSSRAREK